MAKSNNVYLNLNREIPLTDDLHLQARLYCAKSKTAYSKTDGYHPKLELYLYNPALKKRVGKGIKHQWEMTPKEFENLGLPQKTVMPSLKEKIFAGEGIPRILLDDKKIKKAKLPVPPLKESNFIEAISKLIFANQDLNCKVHKDANGNRKDFTIDNSRLFVYSMLNINRFAKLYGGGYPDEKRIKKYAELVTAKIARLIIHGCYDITDFSLAGFITGNETQNVESANEIIGMIKKEASKYEAWETGKVIINIINYYLRANGHSTELISDQFRKELRSAKSDYAKISSNMRSKSMTRNQYYDAWRHFYKNGDYAPLDLASLLLLFWACHTRNYVD